MKETAQTPLPSSDENTISFLPFIHSLSRVLSMHPLLRRLGSRTMQITLSSASTDSTRYCSRTRGNLPCGSGRLFSSSAQRRKNMTPPNVGVRAIATTPDDRSAPSSSLARPKWVRDLAARLPPRFTDAVRPQASSPMRDAPHARFSPSPKSIPSRVPSSSPSHPQPQRTNHRILPSRLAAVHVLARGRHGAQPGARRRYHPRHASRRRCVPRPHGWVVHLYQFSPQCCQNTKR